MAAKECEFKILENRLIARDVFLLRLDGDCSAFSGAGQFCEIRIPGKYLRRPISVCDIAENTLTLIYKVMGEGTEELSFMEEGEYLPVLTGLGNGYDLSACPNNPVLAGGGVGVPPLYFLCKKLIEAGKHPYVALGFRSKEDVFFLEEFRALGVPVNLVTEDGSAGQKGFVTSMPFPADRKRCSARCMRWWRTDSSALKNGWVADLAPAWDAPGRCAPE